MLDNLGAPLIGELAPLLRRAVDLDATSLVRLRSTDSAVGAFVRLPFDVLVARVLAAPEVTDEMDETYFAADVLAWASDTAGSAATEAASEPDRRDALWRGSLPPHAGWARLEVVPDDVIRPLVRTGALTLKEAGIGPASQPPSAVSESVLGAVVLSVTGEDGGHAEVTLRMLSALTRMGFLPRGSSATVDINGAWTRVAAAYGSVYGEPASLSLL